MKNIMNFTVIFLLLMNAGDLESIKQTEMSSLSHPKVGRQALTHDFSSFGKSAASFSNYYQNCNSEFPDFDIIIDNPDTILKNVSELELTCIFKVLSQAEIRILHQKDPQVYKFLEACFGVFDASASTALAGTFEQLWLSQDTFFIREVMKSKKVKNLAIPEMIINELEMDLITDMDFEQKLNKLDKKVYKLSLSWEEKAFAKQIYEIAFERIRIKKAFKKFHLLDRAHQKAWIESECDVEELSVKALSKEMSDFAEEELFPIFPIVKHHVCAYHDNEIFLGLMKIILASPGSAAEDLSNILGEIFICKPQFMIEYASDHEEYKDIMRHIDFGFLNCRFNHPGDSGLPLLKTKLDSLNDVRPYRNY